MNKISIIIPMYNGEKFIADCLESLIRQSYANAEIIVVDDGSSDNGKDICLSYCEKDNRIRYIRKENGGVSTARNLGIENATGDFITFIDCDDFVHEDYCKLLIGAMSEEVDMVVYGLCKYSENGTKLIKHRLQNGIYSHEKLLSIVVDDGTMSGFTFHSACAILYKKNIILENGIRFDETIRYNEDGLFNVEYFLASKKSVFINYNEAIYYYRENPVSATHTRINQMEKYIACMKAINSRLTLLDSLYPDAKIQEQIYRRNITLALSELMGLKSSGELTRKAIKKMVGSDTFRASIKNMHYSGLSLKRRIALFILKTKNVTLIKLLFI